jgi:hypothetical protein
VDPSYSSACTDLQTFFQAIKAQLPDDCTITVPNAGDTIDDTTGALVSSWTRTGGSTTSGTAGTAYSLGVGARVRWLTATVVNGRRISGATFIAPLVSSQFAGSGALAAGAVTNLQAAASALVSSAGTGLRIWHRPAPPLSGLATAVTAALVPDKVSWLRSRRT